MRQPPGEGADLSAADAREPFPLARSHLGTLDVDFELGWVGTNVSSPPNRVSSGSEDLFRLGGHARLGLLLLEFRIGYAFETGGEEPGSDLGLQLNLVAPLSPISTYLGWRRLEMAGDRLNMWMIGMEAKF
jgi:hypothetical protein